MCCQIRKKKTLILSPWLLLGLAATCQTRLCGRPMTASVMTRVTAAYTSTTRSVPPLVKSLNWDIIVMFLFFYFFLKAAVWLSLRRVISATATWCWSASRRIKMASLASTSKWVTRVSCVSYFSALICFYSSNSLLNVTHQGGVDQKMPLAISHIKPDSPVRCHRLWRFVFPGSAIITRWCNPGTIWTQR